MVLLTDEDLEEEDLQEGRFVTMWLSRLRMKLKLPKGKCLNLLLFIIIFYYILARMAKTPEKDQEPKAKKMEEKDTREEGST